MLELLRFVLGLHGVSRSSLKREDGQTLAEYALILALIALLVIGAVTFLSGDISSLFSKIGSKI
jgi:pilus assembly protein Flp/PilA